MTTGYWRRIIFIAGLILPAYFFILITLLGLMCQGYDPIRQYISYLGTEASPVKYLLDVLALTVKGAVIGLVGIALISSFKRKSLGWLIAACLVLTGLSYLALAIFPTDPPGTAETMAGQVHLLASMLPGNFLLVAAAATFFAVDRRSQLGKAVAYLSPILVISSHVVIIAFQIFLGREAYVGLSQRLNILLLLLYVSFVSWYGLHSLKRNTRSIR